MYRRDTHFVSCSRVIERARQALNTDMRGIPQGIRSPYRGNHGSQKPQIRLEPEYRNDGLIRPAGNPPFQGDA